MAKAQLFEITTKAKFEPSISAVELALAFLKPSDFEACVKEQTRVKLLGHIGFIATSSVIDAIIRIAKPQSLSNGEIKFEKREYFRWSIARPRIVKENGLTDINYIGTRGKVTGIRISSIVSEDQAHRKKFVSMIRQFKQKYPKVRVQWENCQHTIACDTSDIEAFKTILDSPKEA